MIEENQQLREQKRKAELDLAAVQAKRLKIEQKLEDVIRDSENRKKQAGFGTFLTTPGSPHQVPIPISNPPS